MKEDTSLPFESTTEGLRDAARELAPSGTNVPATEIRVLDHDIVPIEFDDAGNEKGINLRTAARELRKYHEQRDAQLRAFDQAASIDPEQQALAQQQSVDQTYAMLGSMSSDDLRNVVAGHPDENVRVAASRVLAQQHGNYEAALKNYWDNIVSLGSNALLAGQQAEGWQMALAQSMALAGLQAKWRFADLNELEQLRTEDPGRHAAILGEAAQLDQALARAWQTFHAQAAQQQQLIAQASAIAFEDQAAQHDAAFEAANPDLADPSVHMQATNDVIEYLHSVCGLTVDQMRSLWTTNPLFRAAGAQQIMHDAARYRKAIVRTAQQQRQPVIPRNLPPVQRPGSRESYRTYEDSFVLEADRALDENPKSVRAAAKLLGARRRRAAAS